VAAAKKVCDVFYSKDLNRATYLSINLNHGRELFIPHPSPSNSLINFREECVKEAITLERENKVLV